MKETYTKKEVSDLIRRFADEVDELYRPYTRDNSEAWNYVETFISNNLTDKEDKYGILSYLHKLPPDLRPIAIANYDPNYIDRFDFKSIETPKIDNKKVALKLAFDWENSPEGLSYWVKIYEKI